VFALFFGLLGRFFSPIMILIAVFVWLAGTQEAGLVLLRSAPGDIPVMRVMLTEFRSLRSDEPLAEAAGHPLGGFQQDFPVLADGPLAGVLTRNDLAAAPGRHGPETPVGDVMRRDFVTTDPREMLQTAFSRLQEGPCRTLPVVKGRRLLGLLTADNLAEVLMIQEALREAHRPGLFGGSRGMCAAWAQARDETSII
jgi:hypothetical protein